MASRAPSVSTSRRRPAGILSGPALHPGVESTGVERLWPVETGSARIHGANEGELS